MKGLVIVISIIGILILGLVGYTILSSTHTPDKSTNENPTINEPMPDIQENNLPNGQTNPDTNAPTSTQSYNIEIKGSSFSSQELKVKQGDIVHWTNKDSFSHTVTSDSGSELSSSSLSNGEVYTHTFISKGTFAYHCQIHPHMTGKIIVE